MLKARAVCCYRSDLTGLFMLLDFYQDPDSEAGSTETEVSKVSLTPTRQQQFHLV